MAEPSKTKAPSIQGGYGQGVNSSTRSRITNRSARTPGAGRKVVPANNQPNSPANRRRK